MTSLVFLCAGGGFSPLLFLQIASAERQTVSVSLGKERSVGTRAAGVQI